MRILYVEDNPANISLLQRVARMGGHEVLYYNEGEKALENFASDNPDLILMDLQLAGKLGGLDVVRKLRSDGVSKPIVAVTAYAMMGDRERCLEAGCDAYMSKPLPVAELVEMVKMYQDKVNAAAEIAAASPPAPEKTIETVTSEKTAEPLTAEEKSEIASVEPIRTAEPAAEPAAAETASEVEAKSEAAKQVETSVLPKPDASSSTPVEPVTPKPKAGLEPMALPAVPVVSQNGHTTPVG